MPPTPAENEEIIGGGDNKQSSNNVANQCKIVSKFDHVGFDTLALGVRQTLYAQMLKVQIFAHKCLKFKVQILSKIATHIVENHSASSNIRRIHTRILEDL